MHRRSGCSPPPISQCAHCWRAGGSSRMMSLLPPRYVVIARPYRSRRFSSATFFLSHTFHAFFSHSCARVRQCYTTRAATAQAH